VENYNIDVMLLLCVYWDINTKTIIFKFNNTLYI